ncbi:hypothetical protein CDO52_07080 [Nocardiopsis gilva YIM 90087]|uniref:Uncharacterized protein n=1 Tax=Nocardiopsis gilva YIM 90087 TaxID=1235441 RepID=A0A223S3I9_9ACTN|nr:hypothetical protein [Nocardiopsis gilva]ASU82579.1 hypothetical protein CDO52_07080 [Nocardiopsis gilva YIM 90087]
MPGARYLAVLQHSFTLASIAALAFFGSLHEVAHAALWLVLGLANTPFITGVLTLEHRPPAHILRDRAE